MKGKSGGMIRLQNPGSPASRPSYRPTLPLGGRAASRAVQGGWKRLEGQTDEYRIAGSVRVKAGVRAGDQRATRSTT